MENNFFNYIYYDKFWKWHSICHLEIAKAPAEKLFGFLREKVNKDTTIMYQKFDRNLNALSRVTPYMNMKNRSMYSFSPSVTAVP